MKQLTNALMRARATALLLFAVYLLFLFLASGHRLNFGDFAQIKLLVEMVLFLSAGIIILSKGIRLLFRNLAFVVLLELLYTLSVSGMR